MATVRPGARTRRAAAQPAAQFHLADLGVYGFDRHETTILASLVTEDPLLLVGRSGTGKTFLLNTLSEALGLEHRHYNASLISFDDLVGFPYPDEAHATVRFLETPATVWGAESVLIDEISRCKPEHQNRLFSLVHERKLQGLPLDPAQDPTHVDRFGARKARELAVEAVRKGAGECLIRAVYASNVAKTLDWKYRQVAR